MISILLVLATFSVGQLTALSCYEGSAILMLAYGPSQDPVANKATLNTACLQCTRTMSVVKSIGYVSLHWGCDLQVTSAGCGQSINIFQSGDNSTDSVMCSCCQDNCNADPYCGNSDLLPSGLVDAPPSTTTEANVTESVTTTALTPIDKCGAIVGMVSNFCAELRAAPVSSMTGN